MKAIAPFIFIVIGGIWLITVDLIAMKHVNQGTARLMRDRANDDFRFGQPRPWELTERLERAILYWSTCIMLGCGTILFVILQFS